MTTIAHTFTLSVFMKTLSRFLTGCAAIYEIVFKFLGKSVRRGCAVDLRLGFRRKELDLLLDSGQSGHRSGGKAILHRCLCLAQSKTAFVSTRCFKRFLSRNRGKLLVVEYVLLLLTDARLRLDLK